MIRLFKKCRFARRSLSDHEDPTYEEEPNLQGRARIKKPMFSGRQAIRS